MSKLPWIACTAVIAVAAASAAEAAPSIFGAWEQRLICGRHGMAAEERMANCTAAIQSGKEEGEALADLYLNRGDLYLGRGQYEAAVADYDSAIMVQPSDGPPRMNRAWVYLQTGRYREAIRDYDALLARDPKAAASLFGRGVAEQLSGEESRGADDITAAKTIEPRIEQKFGTRPRTQCNPEL